MLKLIQQTELLFNFFLHALIFFELFKLSYMALVCRPSRTPCVSHDKFKAYFAACCLRLCVLRCFVVLLLYCFSYILIGLAI